MFKRSNTHRGAEIALPRVFFGGEDPFLNRRGYSLVSLCFIEKRSEEAECAPDCEPQNENSERRRCTSHKREYRNDKENTCSDNDGNQELPRASKSQGIASRTGAPQCECKDCKRRHRRTLYRALVAWVVKSVARMLAENARPHPEAASCVFYVSASLVIQR